MELTWQKILNEIEQIQKKWNSQGHTVWYRGQTCSTWSLQPSLHRYVERTIHNAGKNPTEKEKQRLFFILIKNLYHRFRAGAWQLLDARERSPWGLVFTMQHYGIPTTLLDWTESFGCALYFAQFHRTPQEDAALFILNPEGLNEMNIGRDGLVSLGEDSGPLDTPYHPQVISPERTLPTIAVAPFLSNPRMLAQRAAFTLSGCSFKSLEEEMGKYLHKIILPAETYGDAQRFLELVGTGHFGYFPDLEGFVTGILTGLQEELQKALKLKAELDG